MDAANEVATPNVFPRLRRSILPVLAVATVVYVPLWFYFNYRSQHPGAVAAEPYDIRAIVDWQVRSDMYRKGGDYLQAAAANPTKVGQNIMAKDPDAHKAMTTRVGVDFLSTLTSNQIHALRDGLLFSQLSSAQCNALQLLPNYPKYIGKDLTKSYVILEIWRSERGNDSAQFKWCANKADKNSYYPVGLSFPKASP